MRVAPQSVGIVEVEFCLEWKSNDEMEAERLNP